MSSKLLFIDTLGCAMNVRDSEHIVAELSKSDDYGLTDDPSKADLILINTCSVREKPVQKLFSEIGHYRKLKKQNAKIGVCGCTASHLGETIIKKAPVVNFVLGARNVSKISEVIHRDKAVEIDIDYDDSRYVFADFRSSGSKALINISIGCDKECAFCIVPHTRGSEVSIPQELLIKEAQKAAAAGAKELHLLGQNVNNYGRRFSGDGEKASFTQLLREISKVDGIERIRFSSPHPLHADEEFLEEFAQNPKICKQIHFPLQSGSTSILKAMRRGYSKEWFLRKCELIRKLSPTATISTDIIVGFPGETREDFEDTLDVAREVGFEFMFSFAYSQRPLTPAADMADQVDEEIKKARLYELQELQFQLSDSAHAKQLGLVHQVLFEESKDGILFGKTDNGFAVKVEGSERLIGSIAPVQIVKAQRRNLVGETL